MNDTEITIRNGKLNYSDRIAPGDSAAAEEVRGYVNLILDAVARATPGKPGIQRRSRRAGVTPDDAVVPTAQDEEAL